MKNAVAIAAVAFSMIGCIEKVTSIPFLDRVMTAGEFSAQPSLRQKVLVFCADDPGRYRIDPNCVNAQQSARQSVVGNGNFPRVQPATPAWANSEARNQ